MSLHSPFDIMSQLFSHLPSFLSLQGNIHSENLVKTINISNICNICIISIISIISNISIISISIILFVFSTHHLLKCFLIVVAVFPIVSSNFLQLRLFVLLMLLVFLVSFFSFVNHFESNQIYPTYQL